MDPLQTAALNALAPYIAMCASANSPAAASTCISQAIGAPNTYVFAELLAKPNIQALHTADPQYARWLKVLEIFSWGTWSDYNSTRNLPELSDAQATKLRLLTILSLCQGGPQHLTYSALLSSLSLNDVTILQSLLTQAIYAGLLTAKLNPRMQRVDLLSISPLRDLSPGSVNSISKILTAWEAQCSSVYREIEEQIADIMNKAEDRQKKSNARKTEVEEGLAKFERPSKREGDVLTEVRPNDANKKGGHHGFMAGRTRFD